MLATDFVAPPSALDRPQREIQEEAGEERTRLHELLHNVRQCSGTNIAIPPLVKNPTNLGHPPEGVVPETGPMALGMLDSACGRRPVLGYQ